MAKINVKVFITTQSETIGCADINGEEGTDTIKHNIVLIKPEHMQLVTWIEELIKCHCAGEGIANKFNAMFSLRDKQYRTIRCEWLRSGRLKIVEPVERKVNYCHTIEEAVRAKKVFTVSEEIVYQIPKRRNGNEVR